MSGGTACCQVIAVHAGGQSESWLAVYPDGQVVLHRENDGLAFLRHGAEAADRPISLAELVRLDARHPGKRLLEQVIAALRGADAMSQPSPSSVRFAAERARPRNPYSREEWARNRTTYRPDPDKSYASWKLSDYATPEEIATAIAALEQLWREMGQRVKALNKAAPPGRTIVARRLMSRDEQDVVNAAIWAVSDRSRVRELLGHLRKGTLYGVRNLAFSPPDGSTKDLLLQFEARRHAAVQAAVEQERQAWVPPPVDAPGRPACVGCAPPNRTA